MPASRMALGLLLVVLAALGGWFGATRQERASAGDEQIVLAAGDIAACNSTGDEATAALLDGLPGTILALGDLVYENGTATEFNNCYNPSWGRHKARTKPAPGNHEYNTAGAAGYYGYFGAAAGDPAKGYYSFDLGSWHLIAINSNCSAVACAAGSAQEQWLRADLAASTASCTIAYWHHPRFSSGSHGDSASMTAIWQALYDYRAEIVLSGHDHTYERFAPQTAGGVADPTLGVREFIVGTGGRSHHSFGSIHPNSEVRNNDSYGVLQLTLSDDGYDWQFMPVAGSTFTDSGSGVCHAGSNITPTPTRTNTPVPTATRTRTPTPTRTPTATSTAVSTSTSTPTATSTPLPTTTHTPTVTSTAVPTSTSTPTATSTPLPTTTHTPTVTSTAVPTSTSTPTATSTPLPTTTHTPTVTSTAVATSTNTPTATPTATSTAQPTDTHTPVPTLTSTAVPTATHTPEPTGTPLPADTSTPEATSTSIATATPTPCAGDLDCDGVTDGIDNCAAETNPLQENTDAATGNGEVPGDDTTVPNSDTLGDACDPDDDNDGLLDPGDPDPRGDITLDDDGDLSAANGCYDGTDPDDDASSADADCNGVLDGASGDCRDQADADGDGLIAGWERCRWGTSDTSADSDGDGLGDCIEAMDVNGNGVANASDAVLVWRVVFGMMGADVTFDINGNGVITAADGILIMRGFFSVSPCL
ncbi:MAG: metallophosphoesterase [Dehalococcoidia bacterium]